MPPILKFHMWHLNIFVQYPALKLASSHPWNSKLSSWSSIYSWGHMLGQETPILGDFFHAEMLGVVLLTCNKMCVVFLRGSPLKSLKQWIFFGGKSLIGIEYTPEIWHGYQKWCFGKGLKGYGMAIVGISMLNFKGSSSWTPSNYGHVGYLYLKFQGSSRFLLFDLAWTMIKNHCPLDFGFRLNVCINGWGDVSFFEGQVFSETQGWFSINWAVVLRRIQPAACWHWETGNWGTARPSLASFFHQSDQIIATSQHLKR